MRLQHVKAHGALYNMACRDEALAEAIARAVVACRPDAGALRPARTRRCSTPASTLGLPVAAEAFADRAYHADGSLAPRSMPGSVIHDVDTVVARAVPMACEREVEAIDGTRSAFEADTLCLHGDTPGRGAAGGGASGKALEDAGVTRRGLTR